MRVYQHLMFASMLLTVTACSSIGQSSDMAEDELAQPMPEIREYVESPGSLWTPNARFVDMYSDSKARRVGDIIVVQIIENSSANKEAKTEATKKNTVDNSVTNVMGLPLDQSAVFGYGLTPTVEASTSTDFSGDGKTSSKGSISGVISARVVRMLPSGNMMISGKKQTRVNDEHQYTIISGIIRPDDISSNNTIQSTYIADMRLDYYGSGIIGDLQNKGFIARVLDKIWPF